MLHKQKLDTARWITVKLDGQEIEVLGFVRSSKPVKIGTKTKTKAKSKVKVKKVIAR